MEDKKFTPEQQGLINTVELAIDWNMDVAPEDVEEYHRLVDGKGGINVIRQIKRCFIRQIKTGIFQCLKMA